MPLWDPESAAPSGRHTMQNSVFTRDHGFYRSFVYLCVTLMMEQAVVLSVNLADNVMVGSYSEAALSGVAAVNQIVFILQQVLYAASNGLVVLVSQYWGKGDRKPVPSILFAGILMSVTLATLFFAGVSLFPRQILSIFTDRPKIIAQGIQYMDIIRFTFPFFAVTTILLGTMRSVESTGIALAVSCVALVINCTINYTLISGHFGAPALGVRGAAIGTLTARILECVIVCLYVAFRDKKLHLRPKELIYPSLAFAQDYLKATYPLLVTGALWGIFNAIQTAVLGHLADSAIAAYSISSTFFLLLKVTSVGASTAATVLIGKAVGRGDPECLREYGRTLQGLFLAIGLCLGIALFLIRIPLLSLYNISDETRAMANTFMMIQSVVICTMSYQMPVTTGIIRGGGDTKFVMYLDLISIWCIVLPLSLIGAFWLRWPPAAIVLCLNADQIFKCIPAAIRVNRYHWIKTLVR